MSKKNKMASEEKKKKNMADIYAAMNRPVDKSPKGNNLSLRPKMVPE